MIKLDLSSTHQSHSHWPICIAINSKDIPQHNTTLIKQCLCRILCVCVCVSLSTPNANSMDYTNRWTSQQQQQQQQQISLNPNPNPNSNHNSSISQAQLYHYPLPQPSFPHLTSPNLLLSFPQPVLPSASDSLLHPPGTDPFANSGLYPSTHVGPGSHVQFPEDPNAASKNWVYKQAEPIRYDSVPVSAFSYFFLGLI